MLEKPRGITALCTPSGLSTEGHFPLGGIFRAERHFLLFEDQLAESGRQKTKENTSITPRGKFHPVENGPKRYHATHLAEKQHKVLHQRYHQFKDIICA